MTYWSPSRAMRVWILVGVRRSHVRLGHEKRRPNVPVEQGLAPSAGLLWCAVSEDRLHVAGIRRRAIEDFRRPEHAAHDFAQRRIFEVRQRAAMRLRLPEIPQTCGARLGLELLNDRHRFPASVAGNVSLPLFLVRVDVLGHESDELVPQLLYLGAEIKIQLALLRIFSTSPQPSSAIGRARLPASRA